MATQLKLIQDDKTKGKSSGKVQGAVDKMSYLINFQQMARAMQYLSDLSLSSRPSSHWLEGTVTYLDHIKPGTH